MRRYRAYGLGIASDVPLPELTPTSGDVPADVTVSWNPARDVFGIPPEGELKFGEARARYALASVGVFHIRPDAVDVTPATGVPEAVARHWLIAQALAILLFLRGAAVLHASAVASPDGVAVFLGESGYGKSTLALACVDAGFDFVSDDIVPLTLRDGVATTIAGVAQMKLTRQTARAASIPEEQLGPVHERTSKARLAPPRVAEQRPLPVRRIYRLATGPDLVLEPTVPAQAILELTRFSYLVRRIDATIEAEHFRRVAAVAAVTPMRTFRRPRDLSRLAEGVELVIRDLAHGEA